MRDHGRSAIIRPMITYALMPPSARRLGHGERHWFQEVLAGSDAPLLWPGDGYAPGSGHVDQYGARAANPSLAGGTAAHFAHGSVLLPTIRPVL
jgi:hypothetical protein